MDDEFGNYLAKSNDTFTEILKTLDERGNERMSPLKATRSDSNTDSNAPIFNPDNSAKSTTQKSTRGRGSSTRGRPRGRGASTSVSSANETKTTLKGTGKTKMTSLFETLGTASKTTRPQRTTTKTICISDSD